MNAWFDQHKQIWRIYMHNGKQDEGWLCGWRSFETIYPESLSANEIPAWRKKVLTQLAALEKERIDLLNLG
jgi:hypothetical protein